MKKIGLIGGMSWESSLIYYKLINEMVRDELGGLHSAKCILESVDFSNIANLQHNNNWDALAKQMVYAAQNLEKAGADCVVICTNTMHLCSHQIIENTTIPFLHIAEATGENISKKYLKKVLLLGTKFTMEKDFYKQVLKDKFSIDVCIPNQEDRTIIHDVIYNELVVGEIKQTSKEKYINIINKAIQEGVEGVILGCTEIPLLITKEDVAIPVFDTTKIHAEAAVKFALEDR